MQGLDVVVFFFCMVAWNPLIMIHITFFKRTQNISEMLHALSHEVGHNMGAKHDEDTKHCKNKSNYLMSQRLHYISNPDSSSEDLFNPELFNSGLFIPRLLNLTVPTQTFEP